MSPKLLSVIFIVLLIAKQSFQSKEESFYMESNPKQMRYYDTQEIPQSYNIFEDPINSPFIKKHEAEKRRIKPRPLRFGR
uniref:Uncharacterized protein n=1 Tax=Rhabditophanes sp. KR3021 TaxID=114890 RepID=A0AC35UFX7_9BILA